MRGLFPYVVSLISMLYVDVVLEVVSLALALRVEFVKEVIEFTLGVAVTLSFLLVRCICFR